MTLYSPKPQQCMWQWRPFANDNWQMPTKASNAGDATNVPFWWNFEILLLLLIIRKINEKLISSFITSEINFSLEILRKSTMKRDHYQCALIVKRQIYYSSFSYPKRTYLLVWLQIYSLLHHESDNALLFSLHYPPKCANHIYSHWFRTELKNGFWCQAFSDWPIRNDMDSLFRLPKMCTLSLPVRIDNAQTKNIAFETGTGRERLIRTRLIRSSTNSK